MSVLICQFDDHEVFVYLWNRREDNCQEGNGEAAFTATALL